MSPCKRLTTHCLLTCLINFMAYMAPAVLSDPEECDIFLTYGGPLRNHVCCFPFALVARTAPTEKPTRNRRGMVISWPPRIDFTRRAATFRSSHVPKPIKRTACPF